MNWLWNSSYSLVYQFHHHLSLNVYPPAWHLNVVNLEIKEYNDIKIKSLYDVILYISEISDITCTYSRAWYAYIQYRDHGNAKRDSIKELNQKELLEFYDKLINFQLPIHTFILALSIFYMIPKCMIRYYFYKAIVKECNSMYGYNIDINFIREVRNPNKDKKRRVIAERYNIKPEDFEIAFNNIKNYWYLLP